MTPSEQPTRVRTGHLAATGALALLAIYFLCWLLAAIGVPASHAFIALFTPAPAASAEALLTGGLSAIVSGGIFGGIVALAYNLVGQASR